MAGPPSSAAVFAMAMDIRGFSKLAPTDHYKVIEHLYPEIAKILFHVCQNRPLDRKTIGDGFMFYFGVARDSIEAAIHIRRLFRETGFWKMHGFGVPFSCRIGLHFGTFYKMQDAIEEREAYFGLNVITVARLEPVVRENEIWCTNAFREEVRRHEIDAAVAFHSLGKLEFAKGWSEEEVFALYTPPEEPAPPPIVAPLKTGRPQVIARPYADKERPNTYFALVRLKHRSDGVEHLRNYLSTEECECVVEAVYDVFGAFDIIIRFRSAKTLNETKFSEMLIKHKIIWTKDKADLTQIRFEKNQQSTERIVLFPPSDHRYLKAFTYIKSSTILRDTKSVREVIKIARSACGDDEGVVTYYRNSDVLILPIVIPAEQYYALAKTIEAIESLVDRRHWQNVSIITYPVHGFQEFFLGGIPQQ